MDTIKTTTKEQTSLNLFSLEQAEKRLPAVSVEKSEQDALHAQADSLIDELFNTSIEDVQVKQQYMREVENLGSNIQRQLVHKSNLLKEPMQTLMSDLQDGGSIAQDMVELQHQMNQIDPNRFNFKMSGFRRLLSKIPGVGTVVANWLVRFETVQAVINDIVESLGVGRKRLQRDNITLDNDKMEMLSLSKQLAKYVEYGRVLDTQLSKRIETEITDERHKEFLNKDVLFPLRQRVIDLQQQQAVNQHSIVTSEAIIQNNKELIRGVDRALNVTVVAFQTASTLSIALEHQKRVLKGVQAINETTNDLLLQTSRKLKEQGVEIQKQSSSASIDTHVLKEAFDNVDSALKEVNSFRVKSLPQLSKTIDEMEEINEHMSESIEDMQRSKELSKGFDLGE